MAPGSDPESEAPAESGLDDDAVPADRPHVDFRPPVVVDVQRDTPPIVKVIYFIIVVGITSFIHIFICNFKYCQIFTNLL